MDTVVQILVGLAALLLLGLGGMSMFVPQRMASNFSIEPAGSPGLNTIRGVIGGTFLASVAMLVVGLTTGEALWLLPVAMIFGAAIIGRVVGIVADGFDGKIIPPLVVEVVMVAVLVWAYVQTAPAA